MYVAFFIRLAVIIDGEELTFTSVVVHKNTQVTPVMNGDPYEEVTHTKRSFPQGV